MPVSWMALNIGSVDILLLVGKILVYIIVVKFT